MSAEVRRGAAAPRTVTDGRTTVHAFSFGSHYDPTNLGFGPMVCHNDDHVRPGGGYPDHPHTDLEIVTWVLEGTLTHTDTSAGAGPGVDLGAGAVQVTSAGTGIRHSELVSPGAGPTRFLQVWLRPDTPGSVPRMERTLPDLSDTDGLALVAGPGGLPVGVRGAALYVGRPRDGVPLLLPRAPLVHLYVARGGVDVEGLQAADGSEGVGPGRADPAAPGLREGDAWRLRDADERRVTPRGDTELVVWAFGAAGRSDG